jgi:hypothetical protein
MPRFITIHSSIWANLHGYALALELIDPVSFVETTIHHLVQPEEIELRFNKIP